MMSLVAPKNPVAGPATNGMSMKPTPFVQSRYSIFHQHELSPQDSSQGMINQVIPQDPQSHSFYFAKLCQFIQAASIDDLKAYNDDHFEGNPYDLLFEELAELVTTYTSESSINRVHRRRISGSSHSSDLSTSSNEGKSESLSASALRLFARRTLSNMKADKLLLIPGRKGPNLVCITSPTRFEWRMAEAMHVAINDGSGKLIFEVAIRDRIEPPKCQ
ncbi:hypothetical protein AnigIFM60653_009291 [Aspergillus niger]|nr:hypothetical protein AnigIFM60653_009291 [Aspergillus niger]GLA17616.1 hypothetical protein AnigIFM62618_004764 [Aspergillus niger]